MNGSYKKTTNTGVLASMLFGLFLASCDMIVPQAFAMGDPPSTCPNLYDSTITSMTTNSNGMSYSPMLVPVVSAKVGVGYSVTFTLHIDSQSTSGNDLNGTAWYRETALGFANGHCVDDAQPSKDITITRTITCSVCRDGMTQQVEWGTSNSQTAYLVQWHN